MRDLSIIVVEVIGLCAFCVTALVILSAMMEVLTQRIIRREVAREEEEKRKLDEIRDSYGDV